jgi:menaquinone-dependent protoporphyrinogen oxidase
MMKKDVYSRMLKLFRYSVVMCLLAAVCVYAGATCVYGKPRTDDDLIDINCGSDNLSAKNVLVAYDTIHGSTAEVAEYIGTKLCERGYRAEVRLAVNVTDLSAYDGVIVGSALYQFMWLEGAMNFLRKYQETLSRMPTALFVVGASMSEDTLENREAVKMSFIDPVLEEFPELDPVAIGLFGGAVDFTENQYNLFERVVLRILGLMLGYTFRADWRDWDTIGDWAGELADSMKSITTRETGGLKRP